jgi:hypothetical protein
MLLREVINNSEDYDHLHVLAAGDEAFQGNAWRG